MKNTFLYSVFLLLSLSSLSLNAANRRVKFDLNKFWNDTVWLDDVHFTNAQKIDNVGEAASIYDKKSLNCRGFNVKLSLCTSERIVLLYQYLDESGLPYYRRGADLEKLRNIIKRRKNEEPVVDETGRLAKKASVIDSLVPQEHTVLTFLAWFVGEYQGGREYAEQVFAIFQAAAADKNFPMEGIEDFEILFACEFNQYWYERGLEPSFIYRLREFFFHRAISHDHLEIDENFAHRYPLIEAWEGEQGSILIRGKYLDLPLRLYVDGQEIEIVEISADQMLVKLPESFNPKAPLILETKYFGKFAY